MIYDLAIIGGGPGGYVAAQRAGEAGMSTVLFERKSLGGVCLNEGCIPTKSLLNAAKLYRHAAEGDKFGITAGELSLDFAKIMARKDKVVKKLVAAVRSSMKAHGVEVVPSTARIQGKAADGSFVIETEDGNSYNAARILICTGSKTVIPPVPGLNPDENPAMLTSTGILQLDTMPESLTVIGGGVIGMEFAAFFNALGSKVCVIEMMPRILGPFDPEISEALRKVCEKRGVEFLLGCKVTKAEGGEVFFEKPDGTSDSRSAAKVLVCVGRKASFDGIGLDTIGVKTARGIVVDEHMRTNVDGVYAAGDVTGYSLLAHTASREGEVAVNHMLGRPDAMSYAAIPSVVYTDPEVASVGLSMDDAQAKGLDAELRSLPLTYSGRFVAETERENGLCKIVSERGSGKVLGMQMIGGPCSELISTAAVAISAGLTLEDFRRTVFPHPSVSEIIKETAFSKALEN